MRPGEAAGEEVEPEVPVDRGGGRFVDVDREAHRTDRHPADLVARLAQTQLGVDLGVLAHHVVVAVLAPAEPAVPRVERRAVGGLRRQTGTPRGAPHQWSSCSGRSVGNKMTSLIDSTPASSIATRSMPIPSPPVGGMPYSSARR